MSKSLLKSARDFLNQKEYIRARDLCIQVLENDSNNYNALVFLGLAEQNLGNFEKSEKAYKSAILANQQVLLAYQGLLSLYEKTSSFELAIDCLHQIKSFHETKGESEKAFETLNRIVDLAEKQGNKLHLVKYLLLFLDENYSQFINQTERVAILERICKLQQESDAEFYKVHLEQRRYRLGADPIEILKHKVESEMIQNSQLHELYKKLLDELEKSNSDTTLVEIKYFEFCYKKLLFATSTQKHKILHDLQRIADKLRKSKTLTIEGYIFLIESEDSLVDEWETLLISDYTLNPPLISDSNSHLHQLLQIIAELNTEINSEKASELISKIPSFMQTSLVAQRIKYSIYILLDEFQSIVDVCPKLLEAIEKQENSLDISLEKMKLSCKLRECNALKRLGSPVNLKNALEILEILALEYPNNSEILELLANVLFLMQNYSKSLEIYEKLPEPHLIEMAKCFQKMNKLQDSFKILLELSEKAPTDHVWYLLGLNYWLMGGEYRENRDYAYSAWFNCLKLNQSYSECFKMLGIYYQQVEKDDQRAFKCFQKSFSASQDIESAKNMAEHLLKTKDLLNAEKLLHNIIQINSKAAWAFKYLGSVQIELHDYFNASSSLQTACRLSSDDESWELLGHAYFSQGKFIAAIKAFERRLELSFSDSALLELGLVHYRMGKFKEAIEFYSKILKLVTEHAPAEFYYAQACFAAANEEYNMGAFGACLDYLTQGLVKCIKLINRDSRDHAVFKLFGDLIIGLVKLENYQTSEFPNVPEMFELVKSLKVSNLEFPLQIYQLVSTGVSLKIDYIYATACICYILCISIGADDHVLANDYLDLGTCLYNWKNHELSEKCFLAGLSLNSNNPMLWNGLGVSSKDVKLAQHAFIQSLELNLKSALVWCNLAFFYMKNNEGALAKQAFLQAQQVDPEFVMSWFGLGLFYLKHDEVKAMEMFEQAFELSKNTAINLDLDYKYSMQLFYKELQTPSDKIQLINFILHRLSLIECKNSHIFNQLGLVLEHQKLFKEATEAYLVALDNTESINSVYKNLIRSFFGDGEYQKAIEYYEKLEHADFWSTIAAGLSAFFICEYQSSVDLLQKAIEMSELTHANLNIYLSQVLYALGQPEHLEMAKQQLFMTITKNPDYVPGILSLAAFGLLTQDQVLSASAINELERLLPEQVAGFEKDIVNVMSAFYQIHQDSLVSVKRLLLKMIHSRPYQLESWRKLLDFGLKQPKPFEWTLKVSETVYALQIQNSDLSLDALKSLALSDLCLGNSLTSWKHLLHLFPHEKTSWMVKLLFFRQKLYVSFDEKVLEHAQVCINQLKGHFSEWIDYFKLEFEFLKGIECYDRLVSLLNATLDPHIKLSCLLLLMRTGQSEQLLELGLESFSEYSSILWTVMALCHERAAFAGSDCRYDSAIDAWQKCSDQLLAQLKILRIKCIRNTLLNEDLSNFQVLAKGKRTSQTAARLIQAYFFLQQGNQQKALKIAESLDSSIQWVKILIDECKK